ncbi:MAG: hypothetical protein EZS28_022680 [Streblomastix strix]|uniref:Uncharacterized protein n=1 Tax=Streblomastix strix TaxID=222440 RepID=A0A5J4VH80_9EUKA|nr:MAG: hypothetical protein EZS28_022680 [Streblomastix strix]
MNSSYGSDGMNTEKYTEIKVKDQKEALKAHLSNTFMDEQQLSADAYACLDLDKMHFVEGDTDLAYWAVSRNNKYGYYQQFNHVIKDKQFYDDNAKYYFPTIENDLMDEKKDLGLAIKNEGTEMIALAPKNYYIKVGEKEKIKLKCVNQKTTKISKQNIVDNIIDGTNNEGDQYAARAKEPYYVKIRDAKERHYWYTHYGYRAKRINQLPLRLWAQGQ